MDRVYTNQTPEHIGETVICKGWVHAVRDHGKVFFIDLRDRYGLLQVVSGTWNPESFEVLKTLHPEDCIEIEGKVNKRPDKLINPDLISGTVELEALKVNVLNPSKVPPFEINNSTANVDEELRLKYRYLDLRSERMTKHVVNRAKLFKFFRNYLDDQHFLEIETPLLTASTPEGARDYVVPTRLGKNLFYALPQSPQQYKQLLMVSGMDRYYQIAKCMRDEDTRGDRQPEFTQLDMELSFTSQEEIMALVEDMMTKMVAKLYPEKSISQSPWPRISYKDSMVKYGCDKPDLRKDKTNPNELAFCWVLEFPLFEWNEDEKRIEPMHHMFTMPNDTDIPLLDTDPLKIIGQLYDVVLNGYEIASGSIRIVKEEIQKKVFSIIGISEEDANKKFGHMLTAFSYGAPPHGGIAPGIDRILMILEEEPNIREVIPFAKTGEGRDPMMQAPASISERQLKELNIKIG